MRFMSIKLTWLRALDFTIHLVKGVIVHPQILNLKIKGSGMKLFSVITNNQFYALKVTFVFILFSYEFDDQLSLFLNKLHTGLLMYSFVGHIK